MVDYEAEVDPDQPWSEDGTADVTPQEPYPTTTTVSLPLEHREGGPVTVLRSEYPQGLVIIPYDSPADTQPETLPMEASAGDRIEITNSGHQHWPKGIVALFS
jgi:hypothetical protein